MWAFCNDHQFEILERDSLTLEEEGKNGSEREWRGNDRIVSDMEEYF